MSIATKKGDSGQTSLIGGIRLSKADLRVEAYGNVDELNAALGFARSISRNGEISSWTLDIQKSLFRVGAALATPGQETREKPGGKRGEKKNASAVTEEDVNHLTELVHAIEAKPGILSDWSIPGAWTESAAFEVARTVCRRAERSIVRLIEHGSAGHESAEQERTKNATAVPAQVLPYMNRLSDLLWLFGRLLELESGVDSRLRDEQHKGARWSKAW